MHGLEGEENQPAQTSTTDQMDKHMPANYNPADYPPVKMRNRKDSTDLSETQRKRRSKNRLSNRRSTGVNYSAETIEEALAMGPHGDYRQSNK
ncbi:hypothetical protein WA026_020389 [Henosepilachna vigintioctopunctata]|uniref:Uncharacterized protein n=1 Tax=Henosepilachna vigintioctopunctata TaxID=420089 RepID=A0AAW1UF21_9CUCU